jgi:hypothetical protein
MNRFTLHQVIGYRLKVKVVQSILIPNTFNPIPANPKGVA